MRNIKELLELMLENQDYFNSGLCTWAGKMFCTDLITYDENYSLKNYINKNRPHKYSSLLAYRSRSSGYYWKEGNIQPRITWIKKHIKKNS